MGISRKASLLKTPDEVNQKPKMSAFKLIMSIIGIACMIFFRFIPPYSSITSIGWAVIGDFVGAVILWTFVDLTWPFFPLVVFMGIDMLSIYPSSTQSAGVYEACMQSIGNWIPVFVIGCLIFCVLLEDSGILRRISYFFISRKLAHKGGWTFSIFLLASALLCVLFLDVTPVQLFFFAICEEIFLAFGFKKGDSWPKFIITSLTFVLVTGFVMTPICHTLSILWMGVYSSISGNPSSILEYTMLAFPCGIALLVLMLVWFRLVIKPDMSKFKTVDWSALDKLNPGPWTKREKVVVVTLIVCLACWIVPGVVALIAPQSPFVDFMNNKLTQIGPLFLAIALMCIIHVDGKPVLNINDALSRVQWPTVILLASFTLVANAIAEDACGINLWLTNVFTPLIQGLSPWTFVTVIGIICIVLTSFLNQVPVGIILMNVSIPICMANGINPLIMAITICIGASMAFTIPPACLTVGIAYGNDWTKGSYILKNGTVLALISIVLTWLICYPLGTLLFG